MATRSKAKKKRVEFSKVFCTLGFVIMLAVGAWMVYRYYYLVNLAITLDSSTVPDAALPIAGLTFILSPILSYLLYQFGLKNSRNKYGVDAEGQPYETKIDG